MRRRTESGKGRSPSSSSRDRQGIGMPFLVSGVLWTMAAAILVLIVRWQQTWPWTEVPLVGSSFFVRLGGQLTPEFFSWIETTRDSMLVFFVALPFLVGLVGQLVLRDRLGVERSALGLWNRLALLLLWVAFFGLGTAFFLAGWRTPSDGWAQLLLLLANGLAALCWLVIAAGQLATISRYRPEGMTIEKTPLSVWGLVVTDVFLCVVLPLLVLVQGMHVLDDLVGTSFWALEGSVPTRSVHNGLLGQVGLLSTVSLFQRVPVALVLMLPVVGVVFDRLHRRGADQVADRSALYSMLAIGGLALASSCHALFRLGGTPLSSSGPLLLPARLMVLPLAVLIGRFILAGKSKTNLASASHMAAVACIATIATGALFGVLLSVDPVGSHLRATYAADAHQICLLLFGGILAAWVVQYERMEKIADHRLEALFAWANGLTLCIGVPAVCWIWFVLGVAGVPRGVADPLQFSSFAQTASLQVSLTVLLIFVFGMQLVIAFGMIFSWAVVRVLKGKSSR